MLLFGVVVILDLYLFQDLVLLNPCFKFSKSLMLPFEIKNATTTKSLVLFSLNFEYFKFSSSSVSIKLLTHNESSPALQLIKGKSGDLQKLQKYLSWIVNSLIKGVIGGHGGQYPPSGGTGCHGGRTSVFRIIFV